MPRCDRPARPVPGGAQVTDAKKQAALGEIIGIVYGTDLPTVNEAVWLGIVSLAIDGKYAEVQAAVRSVFAKRRTEKTA